METADAELYIVQDRGGGRTEWVRPTPVEQTVVDALTEATGLDADEVDCLHSYVDPGDLRAVLRATGGTITFPVEDYEVTVHSSGRVSVR
jgi:hypothetical protein